MTIRSGINGLAIGMTAGFAIGLFINSQIKIDFGGHQILVTKEFFSPFYARYPEIVFICILIFGIIGFGIGYMIKRKAKKK